MRCRRARFVVTTPADNLSTAGAGFKSLSLPSPLRTARNLVVSLLLTFLGLLFVTFIIGRVVPIDPVLAIVVEPGAGGVRSIEADLVNNGEVTFNAVTAITGAGGVASNEADAVLTANADVTVTGAASFRNSGTMTVAAAATFALVAADFENATGGVIGGGGPTDGERSRTHKSTTHTRQATRTHD